MGLNPMNQTSSIGKFPIGINPSKILPYSFESNGKLPRCDSRFVYDTNYHTVYTSLNSSLMVHQMESYVITWAQC